MGGGWVVKNKIDDKAISAPSWGLAGWLGLSLAKYKILEKDDAYKTVWYF